MLSPTFQPGTFEYIEAKIRRDAEGTAFGGDFEWLCRWFLETAPRYRGQFDKVWLWKDWPDRWSTDAGIDIVARTRTNLRPAACVRISKRRLPAAAARSRVDLRVVVIRRASVARQAATVQSI